MKDSFNKLIKMALRLRDEELCQEALLILAASMPYRPIRSQIRRWLMHRKKFLIQPSHSNKRSWGTSMTSAIQEIKLENTKPKTKNSFYFSIDDIADMVNEVWDISSSNAIEESKMANKSHELDKIINDNKSIIMKELIDELILIHGVDKDNFSSDWALIHSK